MSKVCQVTKAAWELLIECQVESLPIRPSLIAEKKGIPIHLYEDFARSADISLLQVVESYGPDGFTVPLPNHAYSIFYNHGNPQRNRWTLMHELAHVSLGHITTEPRIYCRNAGKVDLYDIQADNFAARALCPDVVLHYCCVESEEELRSLTDLSAKAAHIAWRDLCTWRMQGRIRLDEWEMLLLRQFEPFINDYISEKINPTPDIRPDIFKLSAYRL